MERILGRYSSYIYAILRIVAGSFLVLHGTQKLFGFPPMQPLVPLTGLFAVAGVIEIVCGLMVLVGFFAGLAAFILSGFLAVAYFMMHQPNGALPIQNQGELAAVYSFLFLYIASVGSGVWSIDSVFRSGGVPRSSSL